MCMLLVSYDLFNTNHYSQKILCAVTKISGHLDSMAPTIFQTLANTNAQH